MPRVFGVLVYLSGLLRGVEDGDVHGPPLVLRHGHGDAEEGVKRVALAPALGAGQRGPELRLEQRVDEAVVAAYVVGQRLGRHHVVWPAHRILQRNNLL